ncbi:hypothetical protein KK141_05445 [Dyella sp. LX-66]|uniref:hypothetical protein n=1 Tax=unclassified Dyella TaxID=2634549 RepID=UPI001BE02795|nr:MULTISPECIES: hypothetical protein [unclassified Dyella]MBT2116845.1 hypothetical protein [Dyella sp. LX-1]MBT2138975.1 hypothetical protein [Dyella sp. LX-66]
MSTIDVETNASRVPAELMNPDPESKSSVATLEKFISITDYPGGSAGASAVTQATIAIGPNAVADGHGSTGPIAIGWNVRANGLASISVGQESAASSIGVAIGFQTKAIGDRAVVLGPASRGDGVRSVVIGSNSSATELNAVAIGNNAHGKGAHVIALGVNTSADKEASVALGGSSAASHVGAVALGAWSKTDKDNTVSVGTMQIRRAIRFLADAELTAASHEAVTGRQLFAANQKIAANETAIAGNAKNIAAAKAQISELDEHISSGSIGLIQQNTATRALTLGATTDGTLINAAGTKGDRRLTGLSEGQDSADAATFGQLSPVLAKVRFLAVNGKTDAEAAGTDALALGGGASALQEYGVAVGSKAAANGAYDVAIGRGAQATSELTSDGYNYTGVAIGYGSEARSRGIAIGQSSLAPFRGTVAIGAATQVAGIYSICIGDQAVSGAESTVALGQRAGCSEEATNAVALGAHSYALEANIVSVGNAQLKRRVTNMAPAFYIDDAVTLEQLLALRQAHERLVQEFASQAERYQELEQSHGQLHALVRELNSRLQRD